MFDFSYFEQSYRRLVNAAKLYLKHKNVQYNDDSIIISPCNPTAVELHYYDPTLNVRTVDHVPANELIAYAFYDPKPTNFDNIKKMSMQQLAEFIDYTVGKDDSGHTCLDYKTYFNPEDIVEWRDILPRLIEVGASSC